MGCTGVLSIGGGERNGKSRSELETGHFPPAQPHPPTSENIELSQAEACSWFPTPGPGTGVSPTLAVTSAKRFSPLGYSDIGFQTREDIRSKGWEGSEVPTGVFLSPSSLLPPPPLTVPIGCPQFSASRAGLSRHLTRTPSAEGGGRDVVPRPSAVSWS